MDRLDELLHDYEFNLRQGFVNNAEKKRKQILALLRAGAEMRGEHSYEGTETSGTFNWDAALGEDV